MKEHKVQIIFRPGVATDYAAVGTPVFSREFHRAGQPFQVSETEWELFLEPTGLFAPFLGAVSEPSPSEPTA